MAEETTDRKILRVVLACLAVGAIFLIFAGSDVQPFAIAWVLLVAGSLILAIAVGATKTGIVEVTHGAHHYFVPRAENPLRFWVAVGLTYATGITLTLAAVSSVAFRSVPSD